MKTKESSLELGRDQSILIHGNRLIALLIFETIDTKKYQTGKFNFDDPKLIEVMVSRVDKYFPLVKKVLDKDYKKALVPTLFKNGTKCLDVYEKVKNSANKK
jgi:hypothetical protein